MAVNREHWKPPFAMFPSWVCPWCQVGSLALDKKTLKIAETGLSEEAKSHDAWEPEWIDERFSGLLICQNVACGEIVAIGGRTHHVENHNWDLQEQNWDQEFEPVYMYPAPPVFPIADKCPENVADELKKAFALFWSDTGSSANRLRTAAEALLNSKRVPQTTKTKKGTRERLTLHARIEKFKEKDPESADYLLAIKWLGNAGSHANLDALGADDLLNGFEIFEHVIDRVYVRREKHLKKMAKSINARKGRPVKRRDKSIW